MFQTAPHGRLLTDSRLSWGSTPRGVVPPSFSVSLFRTLRGFGPGFGRARPGSGDPVEGELQASPPASPRRGCLNVVFTRFAVKTEPGSTGAAPCLGTLRPRPRGCLATLHKATQVPSEGKCDAWMPNGRHGTCLGLYASLSGQKIQRPSTRLSIFFFQSQIFDSHFSLNENGQNSHSQFILTLIFL